MSDAEAPIIVVSGLPRAGTSLLMQLLEAGGVPLLVDGVRAPDEHNPRGYYELAAVKRLPEDASFVAGAAGRAVKVVAPLLPRLPVGPAYRVILVERALEEVLASQRRMLEGKREDEGEPVPTEPPDAALERAFEHALEHVWQWISETPGVEALVVAHRRLIGSPRSVAAEILEFLEGGGSGEDAAPRLARMAAVVDPALHRCRAGAG